MYKSRPALSLALMAISVFGSSFSNAELASLNQQGVCPLHTPVNISYTKTEAGPLNFEFLRALDEKQPIYQEIADLNESNQTITLKNGSTWQVSNFDSVKGWEKYKRFVVTQNQATFSTYRFALINLDLGLAVPISLMKSPIPNGKNSLFVKAIDRQINTIKLNNDQLYVVQNEDNGSLKGFHENNLVLIGVNTSDTDCQNTYLIIDVSLNSNDYVRAAYLAGRK